MVAVQDSLPENSDIGSDVTQLELFIEQNRIEDARKELRRLLVGQTDINVAGASIGNALSLIAQRPTRNSFAAIILVRCLPVQGLIPEPNATNQIIRWTVELCEGAIPGIVKYLKIEEGAQNYKKFEVLSGALIRGVRPVPSGS